MVITVNRHHSVGTSGGMRSVGSSASATCRPTARLVSGPGRALRTSWRRVAHRVACGMPTYVARIERERKTLLERADVTVEIVEEGRWRGRFFLPPGTRASRQAKLRFAFADGRHGEAKVDHIHPALSNKGPRLVEVTGLGALG
jgi:hypothetical protein